MDLIPDDYENVVTLPDEENKIKRIVDNSIDSCIGAARTQDIVPIKYIRLPLQAPASDSSEMTINFACFGRQQYRGSNGGTPSSGPTVPSKPTGPTAADWSWKPDEAARAAISRGAARIAEWELNRGWPRYLSSLSPAARGRVLRAKADYLVAHKIRLLAEEQVLADQMEGWQAGTHTSGLQSHDARSWVATKKRRDEKP